MRTTGKKIMVILLSFMMTVSTFITFSFAEEPQGKAQPVEMTQTAEAGTARAAQRRATATTVCSCTSSYSAWQPYP